MSGICVERVLEVKAILAPFQVKCSSQRLSRGLNSKITSSVSGSMAVKLGSLSEQFTTTQFNKLVPKMFGDTQHRLLVQHDALAVIRSGPCLSKDSGRRSEPPCIAGPDCSLCLMNQQISGRSVAGLDMQTQFR